MRARISRRNTLARMGRGEPEIITFHGATGVELTEVPDEVPDEVSGEVSGEEKIGEDEPVEEAPPNDGVEGRVVEDQGEGLDSDDKKTAQPRRRRRYA